MPQPAEAGIALEEHAPMRRLLLPLALGLLSAPRPAEACDYVAQFVAGLPSAGAVVPANAQAFAWAPFMGNSEMRAVLVDPRALTEIPVDVRSLGEDVVQLDLPPLEPGVAYEARVEMVGLDEAHHFRFTADRAVDREAPPVPSVFWDAHEGPRNSCENSGFYLDVTIDRVPGALLYEINELMPNDAVVPVGARFESDEATPTLSLSAYTGQRPLTDRCFFVSAVDQAGNRSDMTNLHCITPVPITDGGLPTMFDAGTALDAGAAPDAGRTPDAGTAAPDAGEVPAPDAGEAPAPSGTLESGNAGCGCTSSSSGPETALFAALGLMIGLTRRRRRSA